MLRWRGREFQVDCQIMYANGSEVSEEDAVLLGEKIAAGDFGSLETLWLVSSNYFPVCIIRALFMQNCSQHLELFAITMPLQFDNHIADAGASALGQGLKTSRSLKWLNLVRVCCIAVLHLRRIFVSNFSACC
jgi:hypothetical protein